MRNLILKAVAWKEARPAREEGQTVVEYALVVGGVSIVLIVALGLFGGGLITAMQGKVDDFLATP